MFFGESLGFTVEALDPAAKEIVKKYPDVTLEQALELYAQIYSNQKYCNNVHTSPSAALFFGYNESDDEEAEESGYKDFEADTEEDDDSYYDDYTSYETGDYKERRFGNNCYDDENGEKEDENKESASSKSFCKAFAAEDKKVTKSLLQKFDSLSDLRSGVLNVGLFSRIPQKYYYYILLSNEYLATKLQLGVSEAEQTIIYDILIDKNERFIRYFVYRRCHNKAAKIMEDCVQECKIGIIADLASNTSVDFTKYKFTTYMSRHIMTAIDAAMAKYYGYTLNYSRENTKFNKLLMQLQEKGVDPEDMDDAILAYTGWKRQRLQSMKNIMASRTVMSVDSDDYSRLSDSHANVEDDAIYRVFQSDMRTAMIQMREAHGTDGWRLFRVMMDISDGYSEASIAKRYNITPADVKKYLKTARDYLRNCPLLAQYKFEAETSLTPAYDFFSYAWCESVAVAEYAEEITDSICEEVGLVSTENNQKAEEQHKEHEQQVNAEENQQPSVRRYYDEELQEEFEIIVESADNLYDVILSDGEDIVEYYEDGSDDYANNLLIGNVVESC